MAKTIHSMLRVLHEDRSVDYYRRALGLTVADRFAFDGFTLLYLRSADSPFELELTVNHDRSEPYVLGDGYGHLAVAVDDLDAERARLDGEGLSPGPIREMALPAGGAARFLFLTDPDGYRIEVLQRRGRYG